MVRARRFVLTLAVLLSAALSGEVQAQAAKQLFGAQKGPASAQPAPFGGYSKGCIAGAVQLPETGPTWQAMRLSRNRNWGIPKPSVLAGPVRICRAPAGWQGLYIGDISQPRAGLC